MFTNDKHGFDDQLLTRYLLGELTEEEAERLDERSVADEEFSWRLNAVEDDLVDAYVSGELPGEQLERFKSFYLASPKRRQKVGFAEAMRKMGDESPAPAAAIASARSTRVGSGSEPEKVSFWRSFAVPGLHLQWGFAGAAVAMALMAGFLFLQLGLLKRQISGAESERAALDQRQQGLEKQLNEQRAANAQTKTELERLRNEASRFGTIKSIAVLLMPQTRGTGQPVSVSVPTGIDSLPVHLELESDEFPEYLVTLKDPGSDEVVWRAARWKAGADGKNKSLAISIPAKVLKQQTYVVEVSGIPAKGAPEFISGYVFRVVLD